MSLPITLSIMIGKGIRMLYVDIKKKRQTKQREKQEQQQLIHNQPSLATEQGVSQRAGAHQGGRTQARRMCSHRQSEACSMETCSASSNASVSRRGHRRHHHIHNLDRRSPRSTGIMATLRARRTRMRRRADRDTAIDNATDGDALPIYDPSAPRLPSYAVHLHEAAVVSRRPRQVCSAPTASRISMQRPLPVHNGPATQLGQHGNRRRGGSDYASLMYYGTMEDECEALSLVSPSSRMDHSLPPPYSPQILGC
ncbi:hypothetical protein B0H34DRAFT_796599 [Crassisporium funariophilum]|nr:hypothetical protein B0H34DRAFT_796599 [Crassisporium funariophilum]